MEQEKEKLIYLRKAEKVKCGTFDLRFQFIKNSPIGGGILDMISGMHKMHMYKQNNDPTQQQANQNLPMQQPDFSVGDHQIKYTWIGHSTFVLSFGHDANFLIDPVFSQRCAPSQLIGPKRFRPTACSIQNLPKIDVVLVSHDHYDHLDQNSLKELHKKNKETIFVAGLESEDAFPKQCQFHGLDWTETLRIPLKEKQFKVTFVPACHWSRRGAFDMCKRLWGGFVIETPTGKKVFYSGDTAYCQVFKQIGEKYEQFDLALLPIGAYEPRQFLKYQHVNPQESVKIHKEINSKKSIGVHWGTFPLGKQQFMRPKKELKEAIIQHKLNDDQFVTVNHGASITVPYI